METREFESLITTTVPADSGITLSINESSPIVQELTPDSILTETILLESPIQLEEL